ncbi:Uncharacterised protein [Legionella lansingensis]|uniref:Uncharacterized protein n=1 Tax=Legionella lansingensis TaxID=45067 RepID=A0A0W0VF82_9GAMM|nr:DUF4239 domain-containing protein [Legionella lansingensis]KTD18821.1 hypothetical protein Llan_2424 [Legionella lansingensis]SNV43367.1 Uncharacterised protein [Legionella lansingensis]
MFTKVCSTTLPTGIKTIRQVPTVPTIRSPYSTKTIKNSDPKWLEIQAKAAELEGIEQQRYQQDVLNYQKLKAQFESTPVMPVIITAETVSPKEAAAKILDSSFAKVRTYLGDSINIIEYPLRGYAFSKLEQAFTYMAKDGRVSKQVVEKISSYGLLLILAIIAAFIYEQVKNQKEKIAQLEKEINDLELTYSKDVYANHDIREKIINKSEKLLEYKNEMTKYEGILSKVKEAQEAINKEQTLFGLVKEKIISFFVNPNERQKEQVKSFLNVQNNDDAKQTTRELEKRGNVNSVVIYAEDELSRLSKKTDKVEKEIDRLESSSTRLAEHVAQTGTKRDAKLAALKNTWGYSFFSQFKENDNNNSLQKEHVSSFESNL